MKPGWKTSEFWLSAVKGLFGLIALFHGAPALPPSVDSAVRVTGGVLSGAAAVAYAISRGMAKYNSPKPN